MACSSPLQCVAVGAAFNGGQSTILKTADGGLSWTQIVFAGTAAQLQRNFSFRGYTIAQDNIPHADLNQARHP